MKKSFKNRISLLFLVCTALSILLSTLCTSERSNPLDVNSPDYVPPKITIDTTGTNIGNRDTIDAGLVTITVTGNRAESRFRAQIDLNVWSQWQESGVFTYPLLTSGSHSVIIESKYDGGDRIVRDTVTFIILPKGLAVTYNGNNNTSGSAPLENTNYAPGTSVEVKANTGNLVRTGFTFAGWNTATDGSGTSYAGGESFIIDTVPVIFYARWTQNPTYTVTYDGNNNTSGSVPSDANAYEQNASVTVRANTGNLVRTGYTFAGWNTAADGSGTSFAGGESFTIGAATIILYARWTQNATYTVTYNGNNNTTGSVPSDANVYEQGASVTVRANTGNLARAGYNFTGWNTAADGSGTSYAGVETFNIGAVNVILYAKWTQNATYTVTYNGNGNTSGSVPLDANLYEQGASVTVKANTGNLARTGYTFTGWNTSMDGSGTTYAGAETFNLSSANVILFAKWTQNPTYSVTYNGNNSTGGGVPSDANAYEVGASVTVKANTGNLVRTGFTFTGWSTAADNSGTSYAGGESFNIGSTNVILYAKWTQNATYTVTYNGNNNTSGGAPLDANLYEQGASVTVKANTGNLVRSGYAFTGWNAAADGSGTSYAGVETFNIGSANVILYAKWTRNPTYTVAYNGNSNTSGSIPVDANFYEQGASVTVKANTGNLARAGYTFAGWNTAANGSGTSYAGVETFNIGPANVIFYAKWTKNPTYTVTYNGNSNTSGSAPVDANLYEQGANVTVKANTGNLARTGYTFAGWNTAANGTASSYSGGESFNIGLVNVTLYAKWTKNPTYTVTYNGNGNTSGSVPADGNAYEQAARVTVKANTGNLALTGYTFTGWNTAANGNGKDYAGLSFLTMGSTNVTLYAKWTRNPTYTVTYNGNSSTSGSIPVDGNAYEQGARVTVKTNAGNLARTGYTFAGWNTAANANGTDYAVNATLTMGNTNITLYVKWTLNPAYPVTYNGNNNSSGTAPSAQTKTQGVSLTLAGNTGLLGRIGYTFAGWNTLSNGNGTSYAAGAGYTADAPLALFAKWVIDTFTVTFNSNGGTEVSDQRIVYSAAATEPAVPVKPGNVFAGWFANADLTIPFDFSTPITLARMLYAKWTPVYTVTYNSNQGSGTPPVDPNTYLTGASVSVLSGSGLSRTNYSFAGWNNQADTLGSNYAPDAMFTMGSSNVVLYAKWRMKAPIITTQPTGRIRPVNDSATFTVIASGLSLSYNWQKNGSPITGATNASYTVQAQVDDTVASTYRCIVSNPGGNVPSDEATLSISTVTDIDGNIYHQVKIGSQVWTMENVRVMRYNDGTAIEKDTAATTWASASTPKYCFYDNTTDQALIGKYGALYNGYVVSPSNTSTIAPPGWHVPSEAEWTILQTYLVENGYNWDGSSTGNKIAKSIAAKSDWTSSANAGAAGNDLSTNNRSGFSCLPGGFRDGGGSYSEQSRQGIWWSSTEQGSMGIVLSRTLMYTDDTFARLRDPLANGNSVRLLKD